MSTHRAALIQIANLEGIWEDIGESAILIAQEAVMGELKKAIPSCLMGSYDPLRHLRPSDLAFMAQHELDLNAEGERTDIKGKRDLNAVRKFLALCKGN